MNPLFLDPARELAIARLAAHLGGAAPNPEARARAEGIAFRYAPFAEDFDGVLIHESGRFFIVCNDRLHRRGTPRSRFTFAHELGHYFIPDHRAALAAHAWPAHYSRTEHAADDLLEREADWFAANFLMPEPAFRARAVASPQPGLALIRDLATAFTTSLTATAFRTVSLDLLPAPCAVFRWDPLGRLAGRRMSEHTARLRPEFRGLVTTPPAGSCTAMFIEHLRTGSASGPTSAPAWFPRLTGYDPLDATPLREDVISLGTQGWLTVVSNEGTAPIPRGF